MKARTLLVLLALLLAALVVTGAPTPVRAEGPVDWELVNPAGKINLKLVEVNPHPSTLEGKTVMLRWNGKPNGDLFLDRVGELLTEQVKNVKVIKLYEVDPSTADTERGSGSGQPAGQAGVQPINQSAAGCAELARRVATYKPDLVISSQAD